MRKRVKRFISMLMCVAMVVCYMPVTSLATNTSYYEGDNENWISITDESLSEYISLKDGVYELTKDVKYKQDEVTKKGLLVDKSCTIALKGFDVGSVRVIPGVSLTLTNDSMKGGSIENYGTLNLNNTNLYMSTIKNYGKIVAEGTTRNNDIIAEIGGLLPVIDYGIIMYNDSVLDASGLDLSQNKKNIPSLVVSLASSADTAIVKGDGVDVSLGCFISQLISNYIAAKSCEDENVPETYKVIEIKDEKLQVSSEAISSLDISAELENSVISKNSKTGKLVLSVEGLKKERINRLMRYIDIINTAIKQFENDQDINLGDDYLDGLLDEIIKDEDGKSLDLNEYIKTLVKDLLKGESDKQDAELDKQDAESDEQDAELDKQVDELLKAFRSYLKGGSLISLDTVNNSNSLKTSITLLSGIELGLEGQGSTEEDNGKLYLSIDVADTINGLVTAVKELYGLASTEPINTAIVEFLTAGEKKAEVLEFEEELKVEEPKEEPKVEEPEEGETSEILETVKTCVLNETHTKLVDYNTLCDNIDNLFKDEGKYAQSVGTMLYGDGTEENKGLLPEGTTVAGLLKGEDDLASTLFDVADSYAVLGILSGSLGYGFARVISQNPDDGSFVFDEPAKTFKEIVDTAGQYRLVEGSEGEWTDIASYIGSEAFVEELNGSALGILNYFGYKIGSLKLGDFQVINGHSVSGDDAVNFTSIPKEKIEEAKKDGKVSIEAIAKEVDKNAEGYKIENAGEFTKECTIVLDGKTPVYLDKAYDNLYFEGATANVSDNKASLSEEVKANLFEDTVKVKSPALPGTTYSDGWDDKLIAELNNYDAGTVITLLSNHDGDFLWITNSEITLNKDRFTGSHVNCAVATVTDEDGKTVNNKIGTYYEGLYFESVAAATQAISQQGKPKGTVKLLRDTKEKVFVKSNSNITLDLNNYVIDGDAESQGFLKIVNEQARKDKVIGTGEITGKLIYGDPTNIELVHGIFDLDGEMNEDGMLAKVNDNIIANTNSNTKTSIGYEIADQWIVLESEVNILGNGYELGYKVFPAEVSDEDINKAFAGEDGKTFEGLCAESLDKDSIADLSADKEYKAVIYLKGAENVAVRTFEFDAYYDPSIMITEEGEEGVDIKAHVGINKYTSVNSSTPGVLEYELATNSVTPVMNTEEKAAIVPIAEFDFKINPAADKVYADAPVVLTFYKDKTAKTAYVGTMATIHKIPFKEFNDYTGSIRNPLDGVKFYDFAYAPENYKLAIIADEHADGQTLKLDGENIPVYYTENPAYVSQSTNPNGKFIKPQDNNNSEKKLGVYLAFVPETYYYVKADGTIDETKEKAYLNLVGIEKGDNSPISDADYDKVNLDQRDGTQVNDASLAYQMLKAFNGTEGSHWGYDPADENQYIPAYERLLAENNHDGKLYGTIEDINSILNLALDAPKF